MPRLHLPALILTFGLGAAALAGAGAVLTTAAHAAPDGPTVGPTVGIDNFTFSPPTITVAAGQTVTWVNRDDIPHTVVATDKAFKSHVMDTDEKFSFTFTRPGEYAYFCSLHPHMVGKVVVKGG
jgi:amicyanin